MSETKGQGKQHTDIEPPETGQGAPISQGQGELFPSKERFLKGGYPVLFPAKEYFMEAVLAKLAPEAIRPEEGVFLEDKTDFMAWAREHLHPDQIRLLESVDRWIAEWKGVDKEKAAEIIRGWQDEGKQDALATSIKEMLTILAKEKEYPHGSKNYLVIHEAIMAIDAEIEQLRSREAEAESALVRLAELFENERAREIKEAEQRGIEKGREIERKKKQQQPRTRQKKKIAEESGAITEMPNKMALITGKAHSKALTPFKNKTAYIQQLQEGFIDRLVFDKETGRMHFEGRHLEDVTLQNLSTRAAVKELDLPLLRSLYSAIYYNAERIQGGEVSVYIPTLCRFLDIDIQTGKPADLLKKILTFKDVIGVRGRSFYKLLDFASYNAETNIITFSSPYMNGVLREIDGFPDYTVKRGKSEFQKPAHSFLVNGSISKERNKPATEIVMLIVTLLEQRGTNKKVGTTTVKKKFRSIVQEIPVLRASFEAQQATTDKNKVLKRAFSGAYKILRKRTTVYETFQELTIHEIIPTISTLDDSLKITHKGKKDRE